MRVHKIFHSVSKAKWNISCTSLVHTASCHHPNVNRLHYDSSLVKVSDTYLKNMSIRAKHTHRFHKNSFITLVPVGTLSPLPFAENNNFYSCSENQHFMQNFIYSSYRCQSNTSGLTGKEKSPRHRQRPSKSTVKEFTIKGKIGDHDLNIKLVKIKNLVEKGKPVHVFLRPVESQHPKNTMSVKEFQERLKDVVGTFGKVHQDYSNDTVTKFNLSPVITKEEEILDESNNVTKSERLSETLDENSNVTKSK